MTITIEPLTEALLPEALVVLEAAYGRQGTLDVGLRRGLQLQPDGWLLARADGAPAGAVGAVDYGPLAWIGMMGVHPGQQRRGVGQALMQRLLAWLDARGCPRSALDATAAGAPLYALCGFHVTSTVFRWHRPGHLPLPTLPNNARPITAADIPAVAAYDAAIFGADRTAALQRLLLDEGVPAFLAEADGAITGYLAAQPHTIGPWLANDAGTAEHLLLAALSLPSIEPPGVIFADSNPAVIPILARYGFEPLRTLQHMQRGPGNDPRDLQRLYGQISFALG